MRTLARIAAVALWAVPAVAQDGKTIATQQSEEYGTYLTDDLGQAVYLFTADRVEPEGEAEVTCADVVCEGAWPWVTTRSEPQAEGEAQPDLLGTMEVADRTIATYDGWPLYYHNADEGEAEPRGHGVESFGGTWFLVQPSGEPVGR